jgi:hypothetical protein
MDEFRLHNMKSSMYFLVESMGRPGKTTRKGEEG